MDFFRLIADIFRAAYLAARNRPNITCDDIHAYKAEWYPEVIPDDKGGIAAEGIAMQLVVKFLLANNGPVDTMLKDVYVAIKHNNEDIERLTHMPLQYYYTGKIHEIQIGPRKVWGVLWLQLYGFFEGLTEPPEDLKAELVVEVVAQRPVRKKINIYY